MRAALWFCIVTLGLSGMAHIILSWHQWYRIRKFHETLRAKTRIRISRIIP